MVSIIIVNYNQKNFLKECLKNIGEVGIGLDYEVIVIDNNSIDGSQEFLSKLQGGGLKFQVVLNDKNLGFARANNQGIKLASGKYVLILNPDVVVLPGSIEKLAQFLERNPQVGMVGPQLLNPDGTIQYSPRRFPRFYTPILCRTFLGRLPGFKKELARYLMLDFNHRQVSEVDWLLGAALMIRKEVLIKVGLFDERFFLYMEDVDLARRIREAGFKVYYFPGAQMYHFHQRLSALYFGPAMFSKIARIHISSAFKYFWKWRKR